MNDERIEGLKTRDQKWKDSKQDSVYISRKIIESKAWLSIDTRTKAHLVYTLFLLKRVMVQRRLPGRGMKVWDIANNGKIEFTHLEAERKYGIASGPFKNAIGELISVGLLDITHQGGGTQRDKSLYAFSDRWKKFGTAEFIEVEPPKGQKGPGNGGRFKKKSTSADTGCSTPADTG